MIISLRVTTTGHQLTETVMAVVRSKGKDVLYVYPRHLYDLSSFLFCWHVKVSFLINFGRLNSFRCRLRRGTITKAQELLEPTAKHP